MLRTDAAGVEMDIIGAPPLASAQVSYTAFGEPIYETTGGLEVGAPLPAGHPRHSYVGEYGYEADQLILAGAPGTAPITLSHVGARWYYPANGRFVQRDPIGIDGGLNAYHYTSANPSASIDPTGLINDNGDYVPPRWGDWPPFGAGSAAGAIGNLRRPKLRHLKGASPTQNIWCDVLPKMPNNSVTLRFWLKRIMGPVGVGIDVVCIVVYLDARYGNPSPYAPSGSGLLDKTDGGAIFR